MNTNKKFLGIGIFSAVAASLCCITPVLALVSGASGVVSTFSWIEPARPYLIGITVLLMGLAWYQKLKPRTAEEIQCDCEPGRSEDRKDKQPFMQTKIFLGFATLFAVLMLGFPYYSNIFYPSMAKKEVVINHASDIQSITFEIEGMTCGGCEAHVENDVNKLPGIIKINASYEDANAKVAFDQTKINLAAIEDAINGTGYIVKSKNKN